MPEAARLPTRPPGRSYVRLMCHLYHRKESETD
ncbi:unnamed protein product [Ectocarpus sp. CCAP 1310/34]|nr:unnamed protein product [Ectocarpus sp. CCAP 1310/34]